MTAPVRRFPAETLRAFGEAVLARVGARPDGAQTVVRVLLDADRFGVGTHGLVRLPSYCAQARSGELVPDAEPVVVRDDGPTALVDGQSGFGAVTATFAIDRAIERARAHGVGIVLAVGGHHFGAAAAYSRRAAEAGLVGIAATSTPAVMAPYGGAEARIGNNPLSVAAPLPDGRAPFVLDMAQSASSRGRIKLAELGDEQIPEGWAIDTGGAPTTDPAAALAGVLLPAGGHKGSGLAFAVEVLTACLAGGELGAELTNAASLTGGPAVPGTRPGTTSSFYAALDPERFGGREAFLERTGRLADSVAATAPAPGFSEVLLPGAIESRAAADSGREGIGLEESTVAMLWELGQAEGVPFPS